MSQAESQPTPRPPRTRHLGALRHRNYRLFFGGQVVSTVGTWMQSIAQPWLVLQLTHSGFWVGVVLAAQFTPVLVAGPLGGVVADRFSKRRVLLVTQACYMIPAFALFLVSATHVAQVWMVLLAAVAVGCINVFDMPTRQSFVIEMVGREDLMNAIALNSSVFNGASVLGPSVAGVLIGAVGVPICFFINSLSYLAALTALLLMRNLPRLVGEPRQPLLDRIREGARYARGDPVVGMMLVAVAVFSLFAMNRLTLLPLFADQVLRVGPAGFGFLMAAQGAGAVAAALSLAFLPPGYATGRRQFWVAVVWVLVLEAFSLSRSVPVSIVLLLLAGFGQMWFLATANTRIQTITPDRLRGRVMALYGQALMGVGPLGSLQAGTLSVLFGAPWAMAIGAALAGLVLLGIRLARPAVFTLEAGDYPANVT
ncbi:MAG TPA: MFS transporter [Candidatus Acidoferrales bacterium]|nr:MFS transporter [Candidatus Acidoferrales bacterium]